ncbi:response regulator [Gramella jeungdoensis]|uniref:Response regulator n=1 Tax=Gramella jeungdoensis TaxID=708091 RepID=A0ABT0YZ60_9FLAO|nr:response regulator [Gramella jeungdoensis]MCM8568766.1 response regulator [Gramella jeungdoensis]
MKKDICVIDDDEIYQKIIRKLITRAGVFEKAFFYMNAVDALEDLKNPETSLPSVILLDINMPAMDGWQFIELLQDSYPSLFSKCDIYIVTSSIAYSDKEKMEDLPGLAGFLSKPINVDKLVEIGEAVK